MSSIDNSGIDETKPATGSATTESVRSNFAAIKAQFATAKQELSDLSGLTSASDARTNLGLGTAAVVDTGTAAGEVPTNADLGTASLLAKTDVQWPLEYAVTYASTTSFTTDTTVTDDAGQLIWTAGRRVRVHLQSSDVYRYGTVENVTSGASGTVTAAWDSGTLSNEALTAWVGINSVQNSSIPWPVADLRTWGTDYAAFQAAVTACQANGWALRLPQGTISLTLGAGEAVTIDPAKPLNIIGAGRRITIISANNTPLRIQQENADAVASTAASAAISYGDRAISVADSAGFAKGQLVYISSTENMEETSRTYVKQMTALVQSIGSGTITLSRAAPMGFSVTGETVTVRGFAVAPIRIEGLTFAVDAALGGGVYGIGLQLAANVDLVDVEVYEQSRADLRDPALDGSVPLLSGAAAMRCVNVQLTRPHFENVLYGVIAQEGSSDVILDRPTAFFCRHTQNFGVGSSGCRVLHGVAHSCYAGFDSHETAIDSYFVGCRDEAGQIPSKFRGRRDELIDCKLLSGMHATVDSGVLSAFGPTTTIGATLAKVFRNTDVVDPDDRRTRVAAHNLVIMGGHWRDVLMFKAGTLSHVSLGGGLVVSAPNVVGRTDAQFTVNGEVRTVIRDVVALGPDAGSAASDARSSSRIFLYVTTADTEIIMGGGFYIDGWRSGVFFNVSGTENGARIRDGAILNCGEAVRNVGGIDTYIGALDNIKFNGNFSDISSASRLLQGLDYYRLSQVLEIKDGITAPSASSGLTRIYVDAADGDLKVVFGDGTVKTIVTDT